MEQNAKVNTLLANLTHEKCGEKKTSFRFVHCKTISEDDLNTSDINENIEDGALSDVLDDIPFIIAGHEDLPEEVYHYCGLLR